MLPKRVFLTKLYMSKNTDQIQKGFIPDVVSLFHKYRFDSFLTNYTETGTFPDKRQWKRIVEEAVLVYATHAEQTVFSNDDDLRFYKSLCAIDGAQEAAMYGNNNMHILWRLMPQYRSFSHQCIFWASLCTVRLGREVLKCEYCNLPYDNLVVHFVTSCNKYATAREVFWNILVDSVSVACSAYYNNLSDSDFISMLLRKELFVNDSVSEAEMEETVITCAKVWYCLRKESEKLGLWLTKA
jgi:hypothetical protein